MEDFGSQRREMDDKLHRELGKLDMLKDLMNRSNGLTDNMMTILTSFETRLGKLEETINPVYQETGNLQRRHENIEKTLAHLDHVIGYYHFADEVDPVIREGPSSDLNKYLECMGKLHKAVQFFTKNNPGSTEMSHVTSLYDAGKDSLEREFRNLLSRHSRPASAVKILDAVTVDEELPQHDPGHLELPPERVQAELKQIAGWLNTCGSNTDYMQVYGSIRSSILLKSLMNLKDHLRTGSKDSTSMNLASPSMTSKSKGAKDTPSRKSGLSKMALVKNASASIMKQSFVQHLEAAGLKRVGSTSSEMSEGVEVDIDFFTIGVSAFLKLMQSEVALMQDIIPIKHQHQIFERIIDASMEFISKEGQQIVINVRNAYMRHDHSAVLGIFPVLKHLRFVKPDFDKTLKACQGPVKNKLDTLICNLEQTGAKGLEEFVENVKHDPGKSTNMPRDGTVHELTNNTIIFLEQLLEFWETAGAMLMAQDSSVVASRTNPEIAKKKVSEFITKVLASLALNLSNKAETYPDATMRAIFMLNNNNYILKSLKRDNILKVARIQARDIEAHYEDNIIREKRIYSQRAGLLDLVLLTRNDLEDTYMLHILENKKNYMSSWSRVMHYISEKSAAGHKQSPDGKLKDKDRQAIKDRFTGFNKEMEELYRVQKNYAIPDSDLRESLRQDNKDFVLPSYRSFLERHRHINFTKNPDKYFKYSVEDVGKMISNFFDSAA